MSHDNDPQKISAADFHIIRDKLQFVRNAIADENMASFPVDEVYYCDGKECTSKGSLFRNSEGAIARDFFLYVSLEQVYHFIAKRGFGPYDDLQFADHVSRKICQNLNDFWHEVLCKDRRRRFLTLQRYEQLNRLDHLCALLSSGLSQRQIDILYALDEMQAVDADSRCKADDIAEKIKPNSYLTGQSLKHQLTKLVKRGLIESKSSRGGGYWLTPSGIEHIQEQL